MKCTKKSVAFSVSENLKKKKKGKPLKIQLVCSWNEKWLTYSNLLCFNEMEIILNTWVSSYVSVQIEISSLSVVGYS